MRSVVRADSIEETCSIRDSFFRSLSLSSSAGHGSDPSERIANEDGSRAAIAWRRALPVFRTVFEQPIGAHLYAPAQTMNRLTGALALFTLLDSTAGCSTAVVPVAPVETAPLVLPSDIGPILVLVDHLPEKEKFVAARAEQVASALRHFSAHTSWRYVDAVPIETVASAAAVVYLGLNGNAPPSPDALARLRGAHRLIVSRYHLAALREAGIAFRHTAGGKDIAVPPNTAVRYRGQSFPSSLPDFLAFEAKAPARVLSTYRVPVPEQTSLPHIVHDLD